MWDWSSTTVTSSVEPDCYLFSVWQKNTLRWHHGFKLQTIIGKTGNCCLRVWFGVMTVRPIWSPAALVFTLTWIWWFQTTWKMHIHESMRSEWVQNTWQWKHFHFRTFVLLFLHTASPASFGGKAFCCFKPFYGSIELPSKYRGSRWPGLAERLQLSKDKKTPFVAVASVSVRRLTHQATNQ